jgi:hypothetical protein
MKNVWVTIVAIGSAAAQPYPYTMVSATGTDSPGCCTFRTLQFAADRTSAHGIVKVLDVAEYGVVTVNKSMTIDGSGLATIDVPAGQSFGIWVTAGNVTIRNLTIRANNPGLLMHGILSEGNTHLENVGITGTTGDGVKADAGTLLARNLTITAQTSNAGIWLTEAGGIAPAAIASIRDSVIRNSLGPGIWATGNFNLFAIALIERSEISSNGSAVQADGAAVIRVGDNVITRNAYAVSPGHTGQVISFRTNMWAGNTIDGSPTSSISLK